MNQFDTKIAGIPCICEVIHYRPFVPGKYSGPFEDSYPDEPSEFDFQILDSRGHRAAWLMKKVTDVDRERLEDEWEATVLEHKYAMEDD